MKSRNQITRIIKETAERHSQVNTVVAAERYEKEGDRIYPLVHIVPGSWGARGNIVAMSFLLIILDLGSEDGSHREENLSDTQLIAIDILSTLMEENSGEDLSFSMVGDATKIVDGEGDQASGWIMEISAQQTYEKNHCETPIN